MIYRIILICCTLLSALGVDAQDNVMRNRINDYNVLGVNITGGYHSPGGDLANRFGNNGSIGGGIDLILKGSNLIIGLEGSFMFGRTVKEDVLAKLRTPEGLLVGNNRILADIGLRERAFYAGGMIGKLFPLSSVNRRSGIRITLGTGVFQHKIRIQDDYDVPVIALSEELKKGYDRLTNGMAVNEFIGYQYLSRNRGINFFAGFEFTQAFTMSRRSFNYDTMEKGDSSRFDSLWGFKIGWTLPFYLGERGDEILY